MSNVDFMGYIRLSGKSGNKLYPHAKNVSLEIPLTEIEAKLGKCEDDIPGRKKIIAECKKQFKYSFCDSTFLGIHFTGHQAIVDFEIWTTNPLDKMNLIKSTELDWSVPEGYRKVCRMRVKDNRLAVQAKTDDVEGHVVDIIDEHDKELGFVVINWDGRELSVCLSSNTFEKCETYGNDDNSPLGVIRFRQKEA